MAKDEKGSPTGGSIGDVAANTSNQVQPLPQGQLEWWTKTRMLLSRENTITPTFGYFRLLFGTQPEKTDIALIVIGTIAGIGAGIPFPLLGILFGALVDDLNSSTCSTTQAPSGGYQAAITTKVLQVIYVSILNFVCMYIHTGCWSMVGERLVRRLRTKYFHSLLRQEISYTDTLPSGDVTSRLVSDIEVIQAGTSEKVGLFIGTISYFVAAYVVAFLKAATIAAMLVSVVPIYFLMAFGGGHYIKKYSGRISTHINAATSIASSSLSHMSIVHAFNANARLETLFAHHLVSARMDALKKAITHSIQFGMLYFVAYASNALAFWQGSKMIADLADGKPSNVSVGAVYTVIFVLLDASFVLSQMAPFMHIFASAASAGDRLMATIKRQSAIDGTSSEGDTSISLAAEEIELHDVTFRYPARPEVPVLQGVSFKIPPNKHTAIVGTSGSGKSTIVALLERLYDPITGCIRVGNRDLKEINVRHLRGSIGLVQQEPNLLDRSILENIAHGLVSSSQKKHEHLLSTLLDSSLSDLTEKMRQGASEDEAVAEHGDLVREIVNLARHAATLANAIDFINSLPDGLATRVGSSGAELSGGQKQRIALARALIRDPPLLLLDEATAALDSTSERLIQAALNKVSENVTTVSIAHRLATAKDADNIIVMQKGKVMEQGTHMNLVAQDGVYAGMVRLQNLGKFSSSSSIMTESTQIDIHPDRSLNTTDTFVNKEEALAAEQRALDEKEKPAQLYIPKDAEAVDAESEEKKQEKPKQGLLATMKGSFPLIRPNLLLIALGLATSIMIGVSYTGEAVIFGHTVGSLSICRGGPSIRSSGMLFGLLFFVLAVVKFTAVIVNGAAFGWAAEKTLYRTRVLSLRSLLRQPLEWHTADGRTPGLLIAHVTSDASALSSLTGTTIGVLFSTVANLFAGVILSHIIAWKIAVVLLATLPVLLASGVLRLRVMAQYQKKHQKAYAKATAITVEAVDNIKSIAAFSLEREAYSVFSRSLKAPYKSNMKSVLYGNFWLSLAYSISTLVYALAYWWGSQQILSGMYTQVQFFIVLPALLFSTQSCGQMFALVPDISKARIAASNIVDLLSIKHDGDEEYEQAGSKAARHSDPRFYMNEDKPRDVEAQVNTTTPSSFPTKGMGVQFRNVHFRYPSRPNQPALDDLTINILPGQFCALVGPSGSGKSTTFALLEKFYNPASGSIFIDGVDITKQSGASFRDTISLVPQENVMFEGTVAFNIGLGARPDVEATQEEIEEACRLANIHDTIAALPDGYNTVCGQDGKQFSGGQRQRLSIARALVRKPRLLLLDESTSALDVESEKHVQDALVKVARKTTIVAIAHRLNTIHRADRIFMIEGGKCVDQGTHAELVERCESYRANVIHQSLDT
ncbi:ABC multidrug transporter mdr4 [Microsporum canis]|uniref:Multidrug resistance protein 1 n=1 Tax=Arthroderma otae (strain ATCC MYA-4605 / CBS 113480) TaxID=554155 RepID=C5FHN6_ARTOC|nr:multidrug resistance protein 1 [Microsporum canis CBS 113480]EEQ28866.1 multidrug resistance protein 1 [Microsporum canis CBS 113480]